VPITQKEQPVIIEEMSAKTFKNVDEIEPFFPSSVQ
jgi:hypothetical protein